jgi:hypothetical protein
LSRTVNNNFNANCHFFCARPTFLLGTASQGKQKSRLAINESICSGVIFEFPVAWQSLFRDWNCRLAAGSQLSQSSSRQDSRGGWLNLRLPTPQLPA